MTVSPTATPRVRRMQLLPPARAMVLSLMPSQSSLRMIEKSAVMKKKKKVIIGTSIFGRAAWGRAGRYKEMACRQIRQCRPFSLVWQKHSPKTQPVHDPRPVVLDLFGISSTFGCNSRGD